MVWLLPRTRTTRLAACGGRPHRPDDPQAGRRDAHVTSCATASVRRRTAASRGKTNARSTATRPCPGTIASVTAASLCRLSLCHAGNRHFGYSADDAPWRFSSFGARRMARSVSGHRASELSEASSSLATVARDALVLVRTGSEVGVDEGGCSPTRATAGRGCRSSRIRPAASTRRLPQSRQRRAAGVADHDAGPSRAWRCAPLATSTSLVKAGSTPAFMFARVLRC